MDTTWIHRTPGQMEKGAQDVIAANRSVLDAIKNIPAEDRTFLNTISALAHASDELADLIQQSQLLASVHPDSAIRNASQEISDKLEAYANETTHDRDLYRAAQEWVTKNEVLEGAARKLADDTLLLIQRVGFSLPTEKFDRLKEIREELSRTEKAFEKTINEYEDHIEVSLEQLRGLPDHYIQSLKQTPTGSYIVSLQYPDIFPFMDLADDENARRELATKNLRKGGVENLERLAHMIALRQEIAGLLGYATHADYVEEIRMSKTGDNVERFLVDIINKLAPGARKDLHALIDIKKRTLGLEHPKPIHFYEMAYWSEKLKKELYDFDPEKSKEYFPLDHVVQGMFSIYQSILGVTFIEILGTPLWHPDVRLFSVSDTSSGALLGYFSLDLYPREGKYGHAAVFPAILGRQALDDSSVPGLVALVCNFSKPTATHPSLLSLDGMGVETLMHEFGHVMHALLSGGRWQSQNGFGVAWDFVEALSQIFEYWVWDPKALALLSKHYKTGEPLPDDLLKKLIAARNHQQASMYHAQAVRSLYDLRIHSRSTDTQVSGAHLAQLCRDMRLELEAIDLPDNSLFPAGWGHMADYDAGYYGYLWSKVYAADMFTRFATDPLSTQVGKEYRTKVLAPGASKQEITLVEDFLSRPSTNKAFLAELGI